MNRTGVYQIRCLSNNKIYVGSASHVKNPSKSKRGFLGRYNQHLQHLRKGKHRNTILQNSWNKHNEDNFIFEILEICEPENCLEREQYYLDILKPYEGGFNICKNALSNPYALSIKSREMGKSKLIGIPRPDSVKDKMSTAVLQYDLNNDFLNEYKSLTQAALLTKSCRTGIYLSCSGKYNKHNNFIWRYKNTPAYISKNINTYKKAIEVYDINKNLIHTFESIKECSEKLNYNRGTIRYYLSVDKYLDNLYLLKLKN